MVERGSDYNIGHTRAMWVPALRDEMFRGVHFPMQDVAQHVCSTTMIYAVL